MTHKELEIEQNYLVSFLREAFPNELPTREVSLFELGKRIGQQEVITKLIQKLVVENKTEIKDR